MDSLRGRRTVSTLSVRGGFDAAQAKARDKAKAKARRSDTIGHLGPEAVVAFVDGEMEPKFMHRVRIHLVHCAECRADVHQQRHASEWVRHSADSAKVKVPQSLLAKLAGIATEEVAPGPDAATPVHRPQQDFLDKVEMVVRAIKHNQRG